MGLQEPREAGTIFLTIRDGRFWQRVNADHPKAQRREMTKEGYEGKVVHEVEYFSLSGMLAGVMYDPDGKFGPQWKVTVEDESGMRYVVTMSNDSSDWSNVAEVLPAIDLSKEIIIIPWKTQDRRGVSIRQNDPKAAKMESLRSFYKTFEKDPESGYYKFKGYLYGFPDWSKIDSNDPDEKKMYWFNVRKFLRLATLAWIEKKLTPHLNEVSSRNAVEFGENDDPFAGIDENQYKNEPDDLDKQMDKQISKDRASKSEFTPQDDDLPF